MSQQTINVGSTPNDGTGDPLRTAFGKANSNFTELYGGAGGGILRSYIAGLTLSNNGGTPNSVLDIAAGMCADSANAVNITLAAFTKSTAGSWASGSGSNGMGAGLTIANSTWYHVFAIINAGSADVYFDTSVTAANTPASTTAFRRIGSFLTDSSAHILGFFQDEETFFWTVPPNDILTSATFTTAASLVTVSAPLGVKTRVMMRFNYQNGSTMIISSPDEPDLAPGNPGSYGDDISGGVANNYIGSPNLTIYTNTSSQIRIRNTGSNTGLFGLTRGWIDSRGRFL